MGKSKETTSATPTGPGVDFFKNTISPAARDLRNTPFEAYTGNFAPEMSNYSNLAGDLYTQAGQSGNYTPADWNALTQQNMSAYTQNVMDPTLALMDRQRQQQLVGEQANIIGSGAFDSSRRGVFEAESSTGYNLARDAMVADLMRQGYNEAQAATMAQQQAQQGALASSAAGLTGLGQMEQSLQGADLAGAYQEFMRQQQDPYQKFSALTGAGSVAPVGQTQTSTYKPGLFDYASAAATAYSSDIRLKENIESAGEFGGVNFYTWDWNEDGKRVAHPDQPKFGVIADELKQSHPHLVKRGGDGFLRVNYVALASELGA